MSASAIGFGVFLYNCYFFSNNWLNFWTGLRLCLFLGFLFIWFEIFNELCVIYLDFFYDLLLGLFILLFFCDLFILLLFFFLAFLFLWLFWFVWLWILCLLFNFFFVFSLFFLSILFYFLFLFQLLFFRAILVLIIFFLKSEVYFIIIIQNMYNFFLEWDEMTILGKLLNRISSEWFKIVFALLIVFFNDILIGREENWEALANGDCGWDGGEELHLCVGLNAYFYSLGDHQQSNKL